MRIFKEHQTSPIFPGLFGLGVYSLIRMLNDSISGCPFWKRDWETNTIEIVSTIFIGYIVYFILDWRIRVFNQRTPHNFSQQDIWRELRDVYFWMFLAYNGTLVPLTMSTDDGMQGYDLIMINTVPMLCTILYFLYLRSRHYLTLFMQQKLETERWHQAQLDTELKFLRAQFHPHFIFNALNLVYFQMTEDVDKAQKTLELFSDILRYQLYEIKDGPIWFGDEIHTLKNYIRLQKQRFSRPVEVEESWDEALEAYRIHPFLLMPLVENAFKYLGRGRSIRMQAVLLPEHTFLFTIENDKIARVSEEETVGGIGLTNLRRRLELTYPDSFHLDVQDQEEKFMVSLQLRLHENLVYHHG